MPSRVACPAIGPTVKAIFGPSKSVITAAHPYESGVQIPVESSRVLVRSWYDGLQLLPRLSIATWYDSSGRLPREGVSGTTTVLTVATGWLSASFVRTRTWKTRAGTG